MMPHRPPFFFSLVGVRKPLSGMLPYEQSVETNHYFVNLKFLL